MFNVKTSQISDLSTQTLPSQENSPLVLVTDDEEGVRSLLCMLMEQEGYRVVEACNGKQCLEAYTTWHPDVVLLDAMMPVMDGFTCCQQLVELAKSDFTPVLMITSLRDAESVDRAFAAGATDYVTKPFHIDVLCQRVRRLIQQSQLYQQVQQLNADLECQVQKRTQELQQALEFEATLKRIADKVRDSMDEAQILATVVQEIVLTLGVRACNTSMYDLDRGASTVQYEQATAGFAYHGRILQMANFPELYNRLLQGEYFQFCSLPINPSRGRVSMLACPIFDDRGVLGDLWLVNQADYSFNELEIRLVQQVANQCAIAIRQARLYQAAQAHVAELQKLNQLKDDFLSTISHELRTPISKIKVAAQMLPVAINSEDELEEKNKKIAKYLSILQSECEQEIKLINDLLTLQQLESGEQILDLSEIDLHTWLPTVVAQFQERTSKMQQNLHLDLPANLPILVSHAFSVERIITELLTNACKYTPANEQIHIALRASSTHIQLSVTNSGIEIPQSELERIFDKFYRIPTSDRWKHRGTGLGLALVKKLVEHIGGLIRVEDTAGKTCFIVEFPINR
ncbi:MAG TPA: phosphoacceptor domain-containing protein [Cyanobacteria bacterium UBA11049]|nr:phosphoacceptor domain-containing protein [Cyanobacteria bacterium UBA11049]